MAAVGLSEQAQANHVNNELYFIKRVSIKYLLNTFKDILCDNTSIAFLVRENIYDFTFYAVSSHVAIENNMAPYS